MYYLFIELIINENTINSKINSKIKNYRDNKIE